MNWKNLVEVVLFIIAFYVVWMLLQPVDFLDKILTTVVGTFMGFVIAFIATSD